LNVIPHIGTSATLTTTTIAPRVTNPKHPAWPRLAIASCASPNPKSATALAALVCSPSFNPLHKEIPMPAKNFVGFGALEDWLVAIDRSRPVNAECIVDPGKFGKFGVAIHKQVLVVSQTEPGGDVLYCRVHFDSYQSFQNQPAFEAEKHHRRGETAWAVIQQWLIEQGLTFRRAIVATPHNLTLLEGHADCLRYDKETDAYIRAIPDSVPQ
jgi:hypothetical protein